MLIALLLFVAFFMIVWLFFRWRSRSGANVTTYIGGDGLRGTPHTQWAWPRAQLRKQEI